MPRSLNQFRSAALISAWTFVSRIAGLVRETLIAATFGAGPLTDAFFVAFRLPNLLRRMFAEGAFTAAFMPVLAKTRAEDEINGDAHAARRLINHVSTALFWVLLAISALGVLGAPIIVWLVASGLADQPGTFDATILMTRLMFPYIMLISLVALASGILQTWQRFAVPAFTPVLLNIAIIGATLGLTGFFDPPIVALACGVMLGGFAQLAIQIPALRAIGMLPRVSLNLRAAFADPGTRRILVLMLPVLLAGSAQQISLLINTAIAAGLATGSVSWISFGDRIQEFPSALLGVALGTVLLSGLSGAASRNDHNEFSTLLDWGLRLALCLAIPAALAQAIMAEPLTALLFHYGQFTDHDVAMTAMTVRGYSMGLVGVIAIKILNPGFFARENVRTPVKIAVAMLVVTQLLNLVFVPQFAHAGLAISISCAASLQAAALLLSLLRSGAYRPHAGWPRLLAQIAVASAAMSAMLLWLVPKFDWLALQTTPFLRIAWVLGLVGAGIVIYGLALRLSGLNPIHLMRRSAVKPGKNGDALA